MPHYEIYMKSHCEVPDYEEEIEADSLEEALEYFGNRAHTSAKDVSNYVRKIPEDEMYDRYGTCGECWTCCKA